MKSLNDILNEDSSAEIQADEKPDKGNAGTLVPMAAGPLTKRSLLKAMKKPEGVIQTTSGQQLAVINPKTTDTDTSEMYHEYSVVAMDEDGHVHEVNYEDITQYSEKYHEEDAMAIRSMTYDDIEMPKTKVDILTAMKKDLRSMKVNDLKASYQYIKAAHCTAREGMHGMGTKKDMLTAMMKDLRGMKMPDLKASYGYIKSSHCGPHEAAHEPEEINASHCTSEETEISEAIDFSKVPDDQLIKWLKVFKTHTGNPWSGFKDDVKRAEKEGKKRRLTVEAVELEEMKTRDDDLAVMIYDFIGADTQGLPLKTLIAQAVGKYFGSQRDKVSFGGESGFERVDESANSFSFDANTELMRVVNSLDRKKLRQKWDFEVSNKKRPVDVDGAIFPLYREATLKIFNLRGEDPFSDEQKKYLLDVYQKAQKGAGFGVGRKWGKLEFSRDGMSVTADITVRTKEIVDKNKRDTNY